MVTHEPNQETPQRGHRALDRRRFLTMSGGALTAGAVGLGASGCRGVTAQGTSTQTQDLAISWWAEGNLSKLHLDVLKQYEAAHPGIMIHPQYQPLNGYDDKLSTELAGGSPPDIFMLRRETFADYITRGAVRQLDDLVPATLPFQNLPKSLMSTAQYKGKWYAIPLGVASSPALIADTVILSGLKVPTPALEWSLDDFQKMLKAVHKASGGRVYGSNDFSANEYAITSFLDGLGKPLFTDAGKLGFTTDDLGQWFTLWQKLRTDQLVPPMKITAASTGFTTDPIVKGVSAVTLAASSKGINGYQPLVKHKLELLSFPRTTTGSGPTTTSVGPIEWFALSSKLDAAKAKQAAELCMYFVSNEKAIMTLNLAHGVPLFEAMRTKTYPRQSKINKLLYDNVAAIDKAGPAPVAAYPPGATEFLNDLGNQSQLIGFGKTTVDKAVATTFADAARVLK